MPENYVAKWDFFSRKAAAFAAGIELKDPDDPDEQVLRALGSRAGVANYLSNTIVNTTESIITATQVWGDPESTPQEKAAAALRCFSGFSMIFAFTGPTGVAAGTAISALLAMITLILDAASPAQETQMQQFEKLLRVLESEKQRDAVRGGRSLIPLQIGALDGFADNSLTWDQVQNTTHITAGITQYQVAVAFGWLNNPENQKLENWEEVYLVFADAVIQIVRLLTKMFQKIRRPEIVGGRVVKDEDVKSLTNVAKAYGKQIEDWMASLMDTVDECGDLWHVGAKEIGYHAKNPFQPDKGQAGWKDIDIGGVRSISVSPVTDRIWARRHDYKLSTGTPGKMYVFNPGPNRLDIEGVIDVCLVPWAGGETGDPFDMLLVTSAGADGKQTSKLMINEWYEKRRGRFFTKEEMERTPPEWGFRQPWRVYEIEGPGLLMARVFRGLPIQSDFSTQNQAATDCLYLVHQSPRFGEGQPVCSLWYTTLYHFKPNYPAPTWAGLRRVELKGPFDSQFFRITVAKRYLYVFTPSKAWRVKHDDIIKQDKGDWRKQADCWQEVVLPWDCEPWKTKGLWGHSTECNWWKADPFWWWSKCLNDLYSWSDDHVVGIVGDDGWGLLMSGHFEAPDRKPWEEFELLLQDAADASRIAQDGHSLVVVAGVPSIKQDENTLYFRVFGPDKQKVVDIDETKVPNRTKKIDELKTELRLRVVRNSRGEPEVPQQYKKNLIGLVTEIVGGAWKWREIGGRGQRIIKSKPASFDYCRWLRQCGANLQTDPEKALPAGAP